MAAPKEIIDLIERLERNIEAYKTRQYTKGYPNSASSIQTNDRYASP